MIDIVKEKLITKLQNIKKKQRKEILKNFKFFFYNKRKKTFV